MINVEGQDAHTLTKTNPALNGKIKASVQVVLMLNGWLPTVQNHANAVAEEGQAAHTLTKTPNHALTGKMKATVQVVLMLNGWLPTVQNHANVTLQVMQVVRTKTSGRAAKDIRNTAPLGHLWHSWPKSVPRPANAR